MNFMEAMLAAINEGRSVRRPAWHYDVFVEMNTSHTALILFDGRYIGRTEHRPYIPTVAEIIATDWVTA